MEWRYEKSALFEAIALMGKAFASPRRLELLDLLAQAPRTVDELARASEQSSANTSQHLQALHAAGMVTRAREGTSVRYALAGDEVLRLWLALRDASVARLAEVERAARDYLGDEVDDDRPRRADRPTAQAATSCSSTCAPPRSTRPATSRARARSRSTSSNTGSPSCRPIERSWPTVAVRSAPTRTRPSAGCSAAGRPRAAPRGRLAGMAARKPVHQAASSRVDGVVPVARVVALALELRRWCSRSARSASSQASPPAIRSTICGTTPRGESSLARRCRPTPPDAVTRSSSRPPGYRSSGRCSPPVPRLRDCSSASHGARDRNLRAGVDIADWVADHRCHGDRPTATRARRAARGR